MRQHFVISLVGDDRNGLVDKVAEAIKRGRGNLEDSRMAVLGAEFAMMMLCSAGAEQAAALQAELRKTAEELELLITVKPTSPRQHNLDSVPMTLSVRGMDHEGIVHEFVRHLVDHGISVEHLDSQVVNAPYSGVPLFEMQVQLRAPASVSLASLRKLLTKVADELNVDVEIQSRPVTPRSFHV
jgi:glycine cleavage system transcriptional repressor